MIVITSADNRDTTPVTGLPGDHPVAESLTAAVSVSFWIYCKTVRYVNEGHATTSQGHASGRHALFRRYISEPARTGSSTVVRIFRSDGEGRAGTVTRLSYPRYFRSVSSNYHVITTVVL